MPNNNERRVALVTGASQGLGAAIAIRLARDGFDVAVTELGTEPLSETVSKVESLGVRALAIALDIRSQASIGTNNARCVTTHPTVSGGGLLRINGGCATVE